MSDSQLEDVARVCNRYPDIQLTYDLVDGAEVAAEDAVTMQVHTTTSFAKASVCLCWVAVEEYSALLVTHSNRHGGPYTILIVEFCEWRPSSGALLAQ